MTRSSRGDRDTVSLDRLRLNHSVSQISFFKNFTATASDQNSLAWGDDLLAGHLALGRPELPTLTYDPTRLRTHDWDDSTGAWSSSYLLSLYALRPVYLLARAFETRPNLAYMALAEDLVASFCRYYLASDQTNPMTRNAHVVADRVENLVYLYAAAQRAGYRLYPEPQLIELVSSDVRRLLDDTTYVRNHNHGIISDKSALIGSYFLNLGSLEADVEHIVGRLEAQISHAFRPDGVHVENSFAYHVAVLDVLWGCWSALSYMQHPFADSIRESLRQAYDFVVYAIKPDGRPPLFGDTMNASPGASREEHAASLGEFSIALEQFPKLRYIESQGATGESPDLVSAYFPSGYVFFREHFRAEDFSKATWLSLKAGYSTRVHKQRDDLSLTYFTKGFDVLVDSGMAGYTPRDKYRDYMESTPAHSTIALRNRSYSVAVGNGEKFGIGQFRSHDLYDYAMAHSRVFDGVNIYRHVYYLRALDVVVVHDEVHSQREVTISQYFNLSNDVMLANVGAPSCDLKLGDSGHFASIRQVLDVDELNLLSGEDTSPMSLVSNSAWVCEPSKTLEYVKSGTDFDFVTALVPGFGQPSDRSFSLLENRLIVGPEEIEIPLVRTPVSRFEGVALSVDGAEFRITSLGLPADSQLSVRIYRSSGGGVISRLPRGGERDMRYRPPEAGTFVLVCLVADAIGELERGILGEVTSGPEGLTIERYYNRLHRPRTVGHTCTRVSEHLYRFAVELEYDYPVLCRWWIYRNGVRISYEELSATVVEYTLDGPGDYVVMYSIQDRYFGEFVFEEFDPVTIDPGS